MAENFGNELLTGEGQKFIEHLIIIFGMTVLSRSLKQNSTDNKSSMILQSDTCHFIASD